MGAKDVKSEDDIGGYEKPKPGFYHVVIKHVDESFEKFDKIVIDFEVLAGTVPNMEGREVSEFFACSDKAISRLQRLALCVGLLNPGEPDRDVEFTDAVGRDLVIEVEDSEYEKMEDGKKVKKKKTALTYLGMWSTGNKEVADVPKGKLEDGGNQPTTQSSAPMTLGSPPTQSSSPGGNWDDI
jgi:hypothetical protein